MKIVLVAAVAENNAIGKDGQLPWKIRSDLRHFRALTLDKPVIMGRKTYESIGKPLDRRTNIVITGNPDFSAEGVEKAPSLDAALAIARKDAERRGVDEIMVIGGGGVFERLMPQADRLEITHVHANPPGDVFFPRIDPKVWREVAGNEVKAGRDDSADFKIATYERQP